MVSRRIKKRIQKDAISDLDVPPPVAKGIIHAGGFKKLASSIPNSVDLARTAHAHLALSDPTRIRILYALSKSDLCPCVLKRLSNVSDSKLSYHLAILDNSGLVKSRKTENWRVYTITKKGRESIES